jgi:hypothetical protein
MYVNDIFVPDQAYGALLLMAMLLLAVVLGFCAVQVRSICEEMPGHGGCDQCLPSWQEQNKTWGDCDLLGVYASVCSEMPSKGGPAGVNVP